MQIRAIGSSRLPSNEPSDKLERLLHLGTLTFYSPTSSSPSTGGRLRKGLRFLLLSLISFVDECLSSLMPHSPPFSSCFLRFRARYFRSRSSPPLSFEESYPRVPYNFCWGVGGGLMASWDDATVAQECSTFRPSFQSFSHRVLFFRSFPPWPACVSKSSE